MPRVAVVLAACLAGCARAPVSPAPAVAPAAAAVAAPASAPLPPAAAGKIRADQVGTVSPVPGFRGGGAGWRIEVQATGGMRHAVRLEQAAGVATGPGPR